MAEMMYNKKVNKIFRRYIVMSEINKENLSPEVAAYIAALENKV